MITHFQTILTNALTPITLITGVGLVKLCIVNRYNHCTDRIRLLIQEREQIGLTQDAHLDYEIELIFKRTKLLRYSMLALAFSAVCSGLLVITNVFGTFFEFSLHILSATWLALALFLMVIAMALLSLEVGLSQNAIRLLVQHLPPLPKDVVTEENLAGQKTKEAQS